MLQTSWHAVYSSELLSVYALLVAPVAFLAYRLAAPSEPDRAAVPAAARFVSILTLAFAVEMLIDPIATGPLLRLDGLAGTPLADAIPFVFVLLGDLRVLWLALGVAEPERPWGSQLARSLGLSLLVPIASITLYLPATRLWPEVPGQVLWMIYELGFLLLAVAMGRAWAPRAAGSPEATRFLRRLLGYSAAYYALWLGADLLIVVGGLDLGWAIRLVPNQLYYGLWAPVAYACFFGAPPRTASNPAR